MTSKAPLPASKPPQDGVVYKQKPRQQPGGAVKSLKDGSTGTLPKKSL